jgi:hypothetical protein
MSVVWYLALLPHDQLFGYSNAVMLAYASIQ